MLLRKTFFLCLLFFSYESYGQRLKKSFRNWVSGASTWQNASELSKLSPNAQDLVREALEDLPGVIDTHMHLICRESKNGCFVHESLFSPYTHPFKSFKAQVLISALGIDGEENWEEQILERQETLLRKFPIPYKGMFFAFAATYNRNSHEKELERTGLEVSNEYMSEVVSKNPSYMFPVHSLNPYQADLKSQFERLKNGHFFKLLPNSMHIAPHDEKCRPFFEMVARSNSVLITHIGVEHSVDGGGVENAFGNPLLYEKWLQRFPNLKIIFAHTGGSGKTMTQEGAFKDNFLLVLDLMRRYPKQTFADLSGFSVAPNLVQYLPTLLHEKDLFPRFLYGSDYPLVAVRPLLKMTLWMMYFKGLWGSNFSEFLKRYDAILEIYTYNPLLASLVIMRLITYNGDRLSPEIFFANAKRLIGETLLPPKR